MNRKKSKAVSGLIEISGQFCSCLTNPIFWKKEKPIKTLHSLSFQSKDSFLFYIIPLDQNPRGAPLIVHLCVFPHISILRVFSACGALSCYKQTTFPPIYLHRIRQCGCRERIHRFLSSSTSDPQPQTHSRLRSQSSDVYLGPEEASGLSTLRQPH